MSAPVCVVMITWNQAQDTLECLETLAAQDYNPISIILVDNGSQDNTVERVREQCPDIEIIELPENIGAVRGYNVGFRRALERDCPYIYLINNDTLLAPDCISELVRDAESADDIGAVVPKIYYAAEPNQIWSLGATENPLNLETCRLGLNEIDEGQWSESRDIDDAPFCAVLFKKHVLEEVGLPDERFYFYYEDTDWCLRSRRAGYRLRLAPAAQMWHKVSASSGGSDTPRERYWMARSSVLYFRKHVRPLQSIVVIGWRTGSAIKTSIRLLRKRRVDSLGAYWQGLWHGLREPLPKE